jgi:hypothetical protein
MKWLLFALIITFPAWASDAPTQQQIAACMPDVVRFCAANLADHSAMRACMVAHKSQLSTACREAFK